MREGGREGTSGEGGTNCALSRAGELKLKLYTDANGKVKGDGRCCYLKVELQAHNAHVV